MAGGISRIAWLAKRPHLMAELGRKAVRRVGRLLAPGQKLKQTEAEMAQWYLDRSVTVEEGLKELLGAVPAPLFDERFARELADARERVEKCPERMGGAGTLDVIYFLSEHSRATRMVETGVAYGWSSLAFLLSAKNRDGARLISTNMPYLFGSEENVGCVVPEGLRPMWTLLHGADRTELPKALELMPEIDICHYDSDKSYAGRMWSHPLIWNALRGGGYFLADDIGDDWGFREFAESVGRKMVIVRSEVAPGSFKTAGVIQK
jgi:predicted O-methyltransferase YrrM